MRRRALALGLLCLALAPAGAHGAYDPVGGGTAKLRLDPSFASYLKQNEIKLLATQGAKKKATTYSLPLIDGNLDPTTAKGELKASGTLTFQGAKAKVPLRQIQVKLKPEPLVAKVGGSQLKVGASKQRSFKRQGFDSTFTARALSLTAKAATRLNKKLRPKVPFAANQRIGTLSATPKPRLVTILEENKATLLFDAAFLAKLSSRFVSVNPIFPAEHQGPSFSFPIAKGGSIAPDATAGTLRANGTVELLQLGGGQVFWAEPWTDLGAHLQSAEADLEPTPAFPGKIGRVGIFDAAPGSVSADPKARTVSDANVALTLQGAAAKALNDAFAEGRALFAAGEAVGSFSFVGQGQ
jgi:hypothetical protein